MADRGEVELPDRSGWLELFGAVELVLALLSAMLIVFMIVMTRIPPPSGMGPNVSPMRLQILLPGVCIYGVAAVFWAVMGVGSIKGTRWARALTLIASWIWLVIGVMGFVMMLTMVPSMIRMINESGPAGQQPPPGVIQLMIAFQMALMGILAVAMPLTFVLFYGSASVKATVERLDLKVRWTDRRPLPILGMSLVLAFGALQAFAIIPMSTGMPFFGRMLYGTPMIIFTLAISIFMLYLAWAVWRLDIKAWFGALALLILGITSTVLTFRHIDLVDLYTRMGVPKEQLEQMKKFQFLQPGQMEWLFAIYLVIGLAFLWYVRRFFKPKPSS